MYNTLQRLCQQLTLSGRRVYYTCKDRVGIKKSRILTSGRGKPASDRTEKCVGNKSHSIGARSLFFCFFFSSQFQLNFNLFHPLYVKTKFVQVFQQYHNFCFVFFFFFYCQQYQNLTLQIAVQFLGVCFYD